MKKLKINSPFRISKNSTISKRDIWLVRIGGILIAFLLAGILCTLLKPGTFGEFFASLFRGSFSSTKRILNLLCAVSIYLLLSLAITPAFKMKFWNIGAEGQALVGCTVTAVILYMFPASIPDPLVILIALIGAVGAGMAFSLIPTFFKVKFNTNETLFTLLMNYIAIPIALFTCSIVDKSGHNTFPQIDFKFPGRIITDIAGIKYLPIILAAVLITVIMYFYLNKTKHGFELSVLGDSHNTARYIGISRKMVSYRTMAMSGAIAGLVGFLLVCCQNGTLSSTLVAGRGFTAVLIAWLGHFNPGEIAIYSFLVGFLDYGTNYVAGQPSIDLDPAYFSGLIIGLFILVVVLFEFFTRYKVKRCLPNEISEARDKIINASDVNINQTVLFEEFCSIGTRALQVKIFKERTDYQKEKNTFRIRTKEIRKQLFLNKNLKDKEKEKLLKTLASFKTSYENAKEQYYGDKKLLKIKYRAERAMMHANVTRLKSVFKNRIATTILVFKSGSVVYESKNDVNNFLNNMNYTQWQFDNNQLIKKMLPTHREMNKQHKLFMDKCKHNLEVLPSDITKAEQATYNYYLLKGNLFAHHYLNRRKFYFSFMIKYINQHNLRLQKKRAKKV